MPRLPKDTEKTDVAVLTTEWLPWLQRSERYTVVTLILVLEGIVGRATGRLFFSSRMNSINLLKPC